MAKLQSRLLLISGTGDSSVLAENMLKILSETYGLGRCVELLKPLKAGEVEKGLVKGHTYPMVLDSFADGEIRVDVGRNELFDQIRGKHVAIIKYLYTPKRKERSINDHLMEARGILDVLGITETLQKTLVAPYLPYLRSHSIEKYKKKGFFQFDSLDMMVEDLHNGGLNCLICIDPHSDKLLEAAQKYSLEINTVNPFRSSELINPAKLGLDPEKADAVLKRLQPFIEHYRKHRENYGQVYIVSPDDGSERRSENFLIECKRHVDEGISWRHIGYRGKSRDTIEGQTGMFKSFSEVNERNVDSNGTYVIPDDMLSTGGTAEEIGKRLKGSGAKRVELWCSHAVVPSREKVMGLKYVDRIVVLDTILHDNSEELHLEYIEASADLLAAELYKTHMKLEAERSRV